MAPHAGQDATFVFGRATMASVSPSVSIRSMTSPQGARVRPWRMVTIPWVVNRRGSTRIAPTSSQSPFSMPNHTWEFTRAAPCGFVLVASIAQSLHAPQWGIVSPHGSLAGRGLCNADRPEPAYARRSRPGTGPYRPLMPRLITPCAGEGGEPSAPDLARVRTGRPVSSKSRWHRVPATKSLP